MINKIKLIKWIKWQSLVDFTIVKHGQMKPKDQDEKAQLVVTEDGDNVLHSLPKQKKAKLKPKHSLNYSVERNIPSAKKH